ncbi:MAG: hypothetical protein HYU88_09395 [Chloroflexi bacterium]|nr:hypothetical protein [Chloroflexota bacterium]
MNDAATPQAAAPDPQDTAPATLLPRAGIGARVSGSAGDALTPEPGRRLSLVAKAADRSPVEQEYAGSPAAPPDERLVTFAQRYEELRRAIERFVRCAHVDVPRRAE